MSHHVCRLGGLVVVSVVVTGWAYAQPRSTKPGKPAAVANTKALDSKAEKLQKEMVRETAELAKGYEDAGQLEKAKVYYEVLQKFDANLAGLKEKLESIDDQILSSNEVEFELNTDKGWSVAVAQVFKDKTVRVQADGMFSINIELRTNADGKTSEDHKEMTAGQPLGVLQGMIVGADKKPGKPFTIGSKKEIKASDDGLLFLRVNVPTEAKCKGPLKVKLSGHVRAAA